MKGVVQMIAKGCTCENSFPVPFSEEEIVSVRVTYRQDKTIKLKKETEEIGRAHV